MSTPFIAVQDFYKSILEKRAAEEGLSPIMPEYDKDSRPIAIDEEKANKKDQRKELENLLSAGKKEEGPDTKEMKKALPKATDAHEVETSNPFIKIAMNKAFFEGLRSVTILKTASADYMKMVYTSFNDELEKIGAELFGMKGAGKLLAGMGKAKPPPIPAAAMKATSWTPGSTITGQSLVGGGVPGMRGSSVAFPK